MTTTQTDDLPPLPKSDYPGVLLGLGQQPAFTPRQMRAYAQAAILADRQARAAQAQCDGGTCGAGGYCRDCPARAAQAEPVALSVLARLLRALDAEAKAGASYENAKNNFTSSGREKLHYERLMVEASNAMAAARTVLASADDGAPDARWYGSTKWLNATQEAAATPPAQPKAEPPLTESEQQSTAQPVAEAYQRGIVQGMNDVLHNGIDWARAKFGGAPLTASKPSEPAQDEALKVAVRMALDAMVKVGGSAEMTPGRYFDELAEPIDACRAALAQIDAISNPRQDDSANPLAEPKEPQEQGSSGSLPQSGVEVGTQVAASAIKPLQCARIGSSMWECMKYGCHEAKAGRPDCAASAQAAGSTQTGERGGV